jgi:hypothetical protein
MPLWRCPHCATPQPESARCWLCGRSTTTCAACRHYRHGVAGGLGLCGLDPRHLALRGTEIRPCWEAVRETPDTAGSPAAAERVPAAWELAGAAPGRRPARTFVPVDDVRGRPAHGAAGARDGGNASPPDTAAPRHGSAAAVTGWSLWGEPDS